MGIRGNEKSLIIHTTVSIQYQNVTDRQKDRQTEFPYISIIIIIIILLLSISHVSVLERHKKWSLNPTIAFTLAEGLSTCVYAGKTRSTIALARRSVSI